MRELVRRLFGRHAKKTWLIIVLIVASVMLLGGAAYAALGGATKNSATTDVDLQKGLIGHWKMDGNPLDSSPYANNGTPTAMSLTTDRKGTSNNAYLFNSASDLISVPYTNTHWPSYVTLSLWVNPSNIAKTTVQAMVGNLQNGGYHMLVNADGAANCPAGLKWVMYIGGGQRSNCIPKTILTDGVWSHIVGTYDGTDIKLYVDGVLQDTDTFAGTIEYSSTTTPLCFGLNPASSSCTGGNYPGSMDDVRLYNRAISQAEVTALYRSYDTAIRLGTGQSGLVAQWNMDGNARDASPYANNGTVTAATLTTDRKGIANSAYSFNGSTSKISANDAASLDLPNDFSVSVWLKPGTSSMPTNTRVVGKSDGTFQNYLLSYNSANKMRFITYIGSTQTLVGNTNINDTTKWYHIVGVRQGTTLSLYVDGQLDNSMVVASGAADTNSLPVEIGYRGVEAATLFNGSMDDIRIYNKALSVTEIAAQSQAYNAQLALGNLSKGLIGHWSMNGSAKDATPYGSNGTVTAATLTTDRKGRSSSAYSFDGTGDYITATVASLPASMSPITVTAWINPGTLASVKNIVTIYNTTPNQELRFRTNASGQLQLANSVATVDTAADTLTASTWSHVAFTYDGTSTRLYVNGVLDSGGASTNAIQSSSAAMNALTIGKGTVGSQDFLGSIDGVRIYNRELSAIELTALYNSYN
jgi:hypothetical protein